MRRGARCDIINAREFIGREYRNAGGGTQEEAAVTGKLIQVAKSAYQYPLILKQLWHAPIIQAPDQEIVYRDLKRFTYRDIRERIGRLASALQGIGVRPGDTVGVLDWDSNRFLEAFFAIPMMGAVLQTVNVRLSPEQIAYTINHAKCSTLIVNDEFAELVEGLKPKLTNVERMVVMSDQAAPRTGDLSFAGEYESLLAASSPDYDFPDFDENTQATTFYTTGTTGLPKGVATGNSCCTRSADWRCSAWRGCRAGFRAMTSTCRSRRCFTSMPGV